MSNPVSLIALILAILCLSLAMQKHYKACFNKRLSQSKEKSLKCLGWLLMVTSLLVLPPTGFNYTVWTCQLAVVIFLQAWLLSAIAARRMKQRITGARNK